MSKMEKKWVANNGFGYFFPFPLILQKAFEICWVGYKHFSMIVFNLLRS
jgi:hypothetical protein